MNKRIQEIAEQAKLNVPSGLAVEQWIQTYNQELADLILKETIQHLTDLKHYTGVGLDNLPIHTPSWNLAVESCIEQINQRFGEDQ